MPPYSHRALAPRLCLLLLPLAVAACASEVRVTDVRLGRSINADNTIASRTTTFTPNETVYISIATTGNADGTLKVRWTYGDRVIGEPEKRIAHRGSAVTEFHLQNVGGFPPGEYAAEVFLNGQPVEQQPFRVEAKP